MAKTADSPGVFLALSFVASKDPEATVAIYPADHFVCPESAFLSSVESAVASAAEMPERILLLGVRPRAPETEYGWVQTGATLVSSRGIEARSVVRFVEKPRREAALELFRSQALWNTSVVVGKLSTLWALGWRHLPEILLPWVRVGSGLLGATDPSALDDIYRNMPTRDFSRHLLEPAAAHLAVLEGRGFFWSDWGQPARILETIASLGRAHTPTPPVPRFLDPVAARVLPSASGHGALRHVANVAKGME